VERSGSMKKSFNDYKKEGVAVLDDRPFNAFLDSLEEDFLIKAYADDPKKYAVEVAEWEKKNRRKIGKPTQDEVDLRKAAWDLDHKYLTEE
jgi:hypothetical protein